MKRVVRCKNCTLAATKLPVGFTGQLSIYCTERSGIVEPDDGCTFGSLGEPQIAVDAYEVRLDEDAAKYGWPGRN